MDQLVMTPLRTFHMHRAVASAITGFDDFEHALVFNDGRMSYNFQLPPWIAPSSQISTVRYGNVNQDKRLYKSYLGLKWTFTPKTRS